jgi:hypothetical protein
LANWDFDEDALEAIKHDIFQECVKVQSVYWSVVSFASRVVMTVLFFSFLSLLLLLSHLLERSEWHCLLLSVA